MPASAKIVIENSIKEKNVNIVVSCSKSGKSLSQITHWVEHCFKELITDKCLLTMDPWNGHLKDECYISLEDERERIITQKIQCCYGQPLDVYYFHHWKNIYKRIFDYVIFPRD